MCTVSIVMIGKEKKFTRAKDEANEYGALWTMPLVLPLVFFFFDSFYSVTFFFCSGLSSLSLLVLVLRFFSSSSVFVRLCFFSDLLFKGGESRGLVYLEAKLVLLRWLASAFLSLFLFFLRLLYDLPSLGLFFSVLLFSCVCSSSLSLSMCIIHFLCSVCPLCVCPPVLVFVRPLFILGVLSVFFPFVFILRSCLGNGMHRGARRMLPRSAVVSAKSGWRR